MECREKEIIARTLAFGHAGFYKLEIYLLYMDLDDVQTYHEDADYYLSGEGSSQQHELQTQLTAVLGVNIIIFLVANVITNDLRLAAYITVGTLVLSIVYAVFFMPTKLLPTNVEVMGHEGLGDVNIGHKQMYELYETS